MDTPGSYRYNTCMISTCVNMKYVVFQTLSPYVTVSYHAGSTETVCCVVLFREGDESAVAGARLGQHTADM